MNDPFFCRQSNIRLSVAAKHSLDTTFADLMASPAILDLGPRFARSAALSAIVTHFAGLTSSERERIVLDYCRSIPDVFPRAQTAGGKVSPAPAAAGLPVDAVDVTNVSRPKRKGRGA